MSISLLKLIKIDLSFTRPDRSRGTLILSRLLPYCPRRTTGTDLFLVNDFTRPPYEALVKYWPGTYCLDLVLYWPGTYCLALVLYWPGTYCLDLVV